MRYRSFGLAVVLLGLLAVGATGGGQLLITKMPGRSFRGSLPELASHQAALRTRLETHVDILASRIGERNMHRYPKLVRAAQYIEDSFSQFGYRPESQTFMVAARPVRNVEVELTGHSRRDQIVVVGAHYDSVRGSPGANDNATGVAALLELARTLVTQRLSRTVRFVAFANEEPPYFYTRAMGSRRYAERSAERGERVVAMLSLETIGYYTEAARSQRYPFPLSFFYPDTGNFVGFVGNRRSASLVKRAVASFRRHAAFPSEVLAAPSWLRGVSWSDHGSFWEIGVPAIMVTDTALYRYVEYHTNADLPRVIDYGCFARVVDGLASVVVDLSKHE